MKLLTLFVHADVVDDLLDSLRSVAGVSGFTVSPCEGHSTSVPRDAQLASRDRVAGHVARRRIELLLEDARLPEVLEHLREPGTERGSRGTWFVTDVGESGRL